MPRGSTSEVRRRARALLATRLRVVPRAALVTVLGPALLSGCVYQYAPPIRSGQDGAPGRLHAHEIEATGTVDILLSGGPNVGYAITDNVAVEGGAQVSPSWGLGYAGTRFTYQGRHKDDDGNLGSGFAADTGVGAGVGRGGSNGFSSDAGGAYLLGGIAAYSEHVAGYLRNRIEQSFASNLPPTLWWQLTAGLEVYFGPFSIFVETGGFGYSNDTMAQAPQTLGDTTHFQHFEFWYPVQGGIALHFDTRPKPKPKREPPPRVDTDPWPSATVSAR
jgi:hypothetical protein